MQDTPTVKSDFLRYDKKTEKFTLPREKEKAAVRELRRWRTDYSRINIRKPLAGATRAKIVRDIMALNIIAHRPNAKIIRPTKKNRASWKKFAQQAGPYKLFIVEAKSASSKFKIRKGEVTERGVAGIYKRYYFNIDALLEEFEDTGEVINEVTRLWDKASRRKKPTGAKILIGANSVAGGALYTTPELCADKIQTMLNSGNSGQAVAEYLSGLEFLYGNLKLHNSLMVQKRKKTRKKMKRNGR